MWRVQKTHLLPCPRGGRWNMGPGKNTNALERISPSNTTKNHNTTLEQKENDNFPETNPEITEIYNLNGREFKAVVRKKLAELQENSERHFNELWNKINKQKEYDIKEMEAHRAGSVSEWLSSCAPLWRPRVQILGADMAPPLIRPP